MEKTINKNKINKMRKKQFRFVVAMLSIAAVNFLVFWLYVNFKSILLAFQIPNSKALTLINFTNFFKEFSYTNSVMPEAIKNTLIFFSVGLFFNTPLAIIFSYFIYKKIIGYKVFRVVFFFPSIISVVVMTSIYSDFVSVKGVFAKIIQILFGMESPPELLGESRYALATILVYGTWTGLGVSIILFGGAMARIPQDVIEYNRLEGVRYIRELWSIVIPMIWPTISTIIILSTVGMFNSSGPILFFTQGNFKTYTLSYWIFMQVYSATPSYEYASAVGLIFTLIGLPIVFVVKRLLDKIDPEVTY